MKTWTVLITSVVLSALSCVSVLAKGLADSVTITVNEQNAGPTPFINNLSLTVSQPDALKSVQFTVIPKMGSVTRPVSATYSGAYLVGRGYFDLETGQMTLPIFGLYSNYDNMVALTYNFTDKSAQMDSVMIATEFFNDPCGVFNSPMVVQARTNTTKLSYDFILMKSYCAADTPVILDTDGEVRWIGTAGVATQSAMIFKNGVYISKGSAIVRMEFDGTWNQLHDYSDIGVTSTGHHNFDPGREGIIMDVNTVDDIEAVNIEVDADGNVLRTWNLATIVSAAITAGGEDPTGFVRPASDPSPDWFHNNATAYQKSDNTLIVSGREDFVIAIDYETGAIKWILGDTTKKWYQYQSLRKFALTLDANSLPPIGQHAVSAIKRNFLLLFDDGANSLNQTPAGENRAYSSPRKYRINSKKLKAREIWNYPLDPSIYSPYCSSIYEDRTKNYLIDYSLGGPFTFTEIIGLDKKGAKVFDYKYPAVAFCGTAWNATPEHLENLIFE